MSRHEIRRKLAGTCFRFTKYHPLSSCNALSSHDTLHEYANGTNPVSVRLCTSRSSRKFMKCRWNLALRSNLSKENVTSSETYEENAPKTQDRKQSFRKIRKELATDQAEGRKAISAR